jgi:hypothetical protein
MAGPTTQLQSHLKLPPLRTKQRGQCLRMRKVLRRQRWLQTVYHKPNRRDPSRPASMEPRRRRCHLHKKFVPSATPIGPIEASLDGASTRPGCHLHTNLYHLLHPSRPIEAHRGQPGWSFHAASMPLAYTCEPFATPLRPIEALEDLAFCNTKKRSHRASMSSHTASIGFQTCQASALLEF